MDIFEYIDRVKANFDKQPEPRYNMKKYFMGGSVTTPKRGLVDEPGSYGGKPRIEKEELIKILNKSKDSTDLEIATKLNKDYSTLRGKTFDADNVFAIRKYFGVTTNVGKVKPEVAEKVKNVTKFLTKEIQKANDGDKFVSQQDLLKKVYKKFDLVPQKPQKETPKGQGRLRLDPKAYPILETLETMPEKVDNVLKKMLMEEEPLNNFWHKTLSKRTGIGKDGIRNTLARKEVQTYNVLKDEGLDFLVKNANKPSFNFLKGLSLSEQLEKSIPMKEGRPVLVTGNTKFKGSKDNVFNFAFRNWDQNRGQGDIKFFDKNGNKITWDFGKQIKRSTDSFSYQGKKYSYQALNDTSLVKKNFSEVYEQTVKSNNFKNKLIENPFKPGSRIKVKNLAKKILVDGYDYRPDTKFSLDILHGKDGVKIKPFTDLRYDTRDINTIELSLSKKLNAIDPKKKISKSVYNKALKELNSVYKGVDREARIIERLGDQAKTIQTFKGDGTPLSIDRQVKTLLASLSRNPQCKKRFFLGGRVGFQDGSVSLDKCAGDGAKVANSGKIRPGAEFRNFAKLGQFFAKTGTTAAGVADILLSAGAGAKGLGVGLLLETGLAMEQASKGQPGLGFSQTILGDVYNALRSDEKEINLENRLLKSAKTEEERVALQNLIDFNKDQKEFAKKAKTFDYLYNAPEFEKEGVNLQKLEDELYEMYGDLQDRTPKIMNKEVSGLLADVSYRVADEGRDKLKGFYGKIFGDAQLNYKSMDRNVLAKSYYDAMVPQVSNVIGIPMFANTGEIQSTQQQLGLPTSYKATPQELDDIYDMGRLGAASGGIARASFGIGGFTKAQFIIQRMKNSLKQAFGKTDADSKYVNETFPNMIKELEANPELGNNPNVFKMFSEDLPKDQRVVVHSDDSIDFFTQSKFGPQNIETTIKFAKDNNISIDEANRILKMEPEDQVLEKTRLQILKDKGRTRQAEGGLTSLTRTIPPERGPNSQGLASFMKNGMK